jgi:hypothetical protein
MTLALLSVVYQVLERHVLVADAGDDCLHRDAPVCWHATWYGAESARLIGLVYDGMANALRSDEWRLIARLESKWREFEYSRDNTQERRAVIPQNSTACFVVMHYSDGVMCGHHLRWRQIWVHLHARSRQGSLLGKAWYLALMLLSPHGNFFGLPFCPLPSPSM